MVTSEYITAGTCSTVIGAFTTLNTVFSVEKPSGSSIDSAQFSLEAQTEFQNYLGYSTCSVGGPQETGILSISSMGNITTGSNSKTSSALVISSVSVPRSNTSIGSASSALSSQPPSQTDPVSSTLSPKVKISIGVIIPILFIVLLILGVHFLRRYRALRKLIAGREGIPQRNDVSWGKPELHGDSCRHEMLDEHRRQEVESEEMRHEMPGDEVPENSPRQEA